jgi:sigma-B regulation protein RsbU (phosphoserine phosphatase)
LEKTIGIVVVGSRPETSSYTEADLDFGVGVAAQAVIAFENAWHFRETVDKRRMEEELALAASIQAKLFPQNLPSLFRCEIAARNRPALECGGDYYDVLPIAETGEPRQYMLCVADVSGKGLPASILMSNLQATLRVSLVYRPSLVELAARTNALLYAATPPDKYITAVLLSIDPATGTCTYVNAGHNGGILLRTDGKVEDLESTGAPLGLLPNMPYISEKVELQTDDLLVLYSDGVPEAWDRNEQEWGNERFFHCLRQFRHLSATDVASKVFEEVDAFVENAPPHDDITLLVLKRTG